MKVLKMSKKPKKLLTVKIIGIILTTFMLVTFPVMNNNVWAEDHVLLKQGMDGEDIIRLQTELEKHGYYQGIIDGKFGDKTLQAVIYFQQDCGLLVDGIVGAQTWSAIKNYSKVPVSRSGSDNRAGQQVANFAQKYLGTNYVWGGSSPGGFDCSGFIFYVFKQHGITLPRMADGQFYTGLKISGANLRVGDAVFFTTYEPGPSHVGIYIGNDAFIHASSAAGQVVVTPMSKQYYRDRFLGARRFVN